MLNQELFKVYVALNTIAQQSSLPFDLTYGIARNIKAMKPWFENYMELRKTAVQSAGGRTVANNLMDKDDYEKLSQEDKKAYDQAFRSIELEPGKSPDWYQLNINKFMNREDGKHVEIAAALIEPLLEIIIVE